MTGPLDAEVTVHYSAADERSRLFSGARGSVELERTKEILRRVLPAPPAQILDVGGGPGAHATWLAADGYTVDLIDPVPLHVQQAEQAAAVAARPFTARLGDARHLSVADRSADVVLLLGPLYHLDADARHQALTEAVRVLRPDGVLVAAAISRFASLLDGLRTGWLADETFAAIVEQDLATGRHHNPDPVGRPEWFTTAWFHRPDELRRELENAGLVVDAVLAVEGPLQLLNDLDERWQDDNERGRLLRAVQSVEHEPTMLGVSGHLLAIGGPGGRDAT